MRSRRALYNVLTNLLLQIVVIVYGFIVPKIIISLFGSDVNGLVTSIKQFLGYIIFLESGFGPVVIATLYKPIADKDNKTIADILKTSEKFFRNIAYIFLIYILLLAIVYPLLISGQFSYFFIFSLILIISLSTFATYYFGMTYRLFLKAEQKTYVISIIQIISYIISLIFILVLSRLNVSIQIIQLSTAFVFVLRPILQNLYVKKRYALNLKVANKNYNIKQKWDGLAQHIAAIVHDNTDVTILTVLSTLKNVSVYSVYNLIVTGIKSLSLSFINGVEATFGDMIAKKETDNLNKKFSMYETMFFSIITIFYSVAFIMITPFVIIYTKGVTDANYVRPIFGYVMVISGYVYALRMPYHYLIVNAAHFKMTKKWSWIEVIVNILVSIILVWKYGLIGVAIGTVVSISVRACAYIFYVNNNILKRNVWISIKKVLSFIVGMIIIIVIGKFVPQMENVNYINWLINAFIKTLISGVIVLLLNIVFNNSELKDIFKMMKRLLTKNSREKV